MRLQTLRQQKHNQKVLAEPIAHVGARRVNLVPVHLLKRVGFLRTLMRLKQIKVLAEPIVLVGVKRVILVLARLLKHVRFHNRIHILLKQSPMCHLCTKGSMDKLGIGKDVTAVQDAITTRTGTATQPLLLATIPAELQQ